MKVDICIYGATPGGVAAAVTAKKMGHSVVLLEPGTHVGGMTSGGLGWTDHGTMETVGGLARDFFDPERGGIGRGSDDTVNGWHNKWTVLPGAAEAKFTQMLAASEVEVKFQHRIERNGSGVSKCGTRITSIRMDNGTEFRARVFIDCSYEGDLMAGAGVCWRKDREGRSEYNESLAGVIGDAVPDGIRHPQLFDVPVDPYVTPGDPESGLLPGIQSFGCGTPGEGDDKVQAYCYRSCLTRSNDPAKRIEITEPESYDPRQYELLRRYLIARQASDAPITGIGELLKVSPLPDDKTDINAKGPFSIDFIGESWTYTEASYDERERICKRHEDYTKGLFWFLKTDDSVPEPLRRYMDTLAYPSDEYIDNGGWSHQLYVREARRMVGTRVMTQQDIQQPGAVEHVIGLGSYGVDSHHIQRYVCKNEAGIDMVQNEGNFLAHRSPYPIPYEAILPKAEECDNLLVTFCVSASHVAFSSIRMEPVLMILSQSAAHAASLAIRSDTGVREIGYEKLRERLIEDEQVLSLP